METTDTVTAPFPTRHLRVDPDAWLSAITAERDASNMLLALWGEDNRDLGRGFSVWAAFLASRALDLIELRLPPEETEFPGISPIFPAASRMERALHDLLG